MTRKVLLLLISWFLTQTAFSQEFAEVRGFVTDKNSSEPVIFTNVYLDGTQYGISTDINGYFSITKVPPGSYTLKVSSVEFQDYSEENNAKGGPNH